MRRFGNYCDSWAWPSEVHLFLLSYTGGDKLPLSAKSGPCQVGSCQWSYSAEEAAAPALVRSTFTLPRWVRALSEVGSWSIGYS